MLTLEELPVPELGPKEVLIAVHTAGVGGGKRTFAKDGILVDAFVFPWSSGRMARAQLLSWVRGYAASKWATRFIPTVGIIPRVDFMRCTLVSAELVAPFPQPPLDLEHAGAVPTTGLTALQGIADHLDVQTGEHVMIHGASGAVGTLAIQFAKERGAKVLAVASG